MGLKSLLHNSPSLTLAWQSEGQGTTLSESAGTVENKQTSATENSQVSTDVDFHERAIDVSFASRNKEVISTPNKSIQMSPKPKESLLTQEESANPPPASPQKPPRSPAKVTEEENTKVKVTGSDPKDTEHAEPMDTGNDLARPEDTLEDKTLPRETQEVFLSFVFLLLRMGLYSRIG